MSVAPSNVYSCSDGHIALIAAADRHWRSVLEVIGRADLVGDERYRRNGDRAARMDEVDELVSSWTSKRTRAEVAAALSSAGVPIAEVRDLPEIVHDDHLNERGFLQWTEHDGLGEIPLPHSHCVGTIPRCGPSPRADRLAPTTKRCTASSAVSTLTIWRRWPLTALSDRRLPGQHLPGHRLEP